jgi:hypothetical protein
MWSYNTLKLQDFTSAVCGQYACLFTLCMDRGLDPHHFFNLFGTIEPDMQVETIFV